MIDIVSIVDHRSYQDKIRFLPTLAKFLDNHLQTLQEGEELTMDPNDNGEPDSDVVTTRPNLNSQQDPKDLIDEKDYPDS